MTEHNYPEHKDSVHSMKAATDFCCFAVANWLVVMPWSKLLNTSAYQNAVRTLFDADRTGSQWLEHGAGTVFEKTMLLEAWKRVDEIVQSLNLPLDSPLAKGHPPRQNA